MSIDLRAAASFVATHARILDRRRLPPLLGDGNPQGVHAALDAYRNPDGGYGWGLEPDLRSAESQPAAALHAFEVFAEAPHASGRRPTELCDWLQSISLPAGGLPFALPVGNPAGCAPWWTGADPAVPSLQITAAVAANALRAARHDATLTSHPWLASATRYCLDAIRTMDGAPHAYELSFALRLLDAAADTRPEASALLEQLGRHLPAEGTMHVEGGTEDERLRPLDFAPDPDRPARGLLAPEVIADDLDRLAHDQQPDGGWPVDWMTSSPAAALEWRGYATVRAVGIMRRNSNPGPPA